MSLLHMPVEILNSLSGCFSAISGLSGSGAGYGLIVTLFIAGLIGGATHCVAMCGPFILAQTTENDNPQTTLKRLSQSLMLPYHLGRITTYMCMAVLFASILNIAFLFMPIRAYIIAPLLFLAGILFLIHAFPSLSGFFPVQKTLQRNPLFRPLSQIVSKALGQLSGQMNVAKSFLAGMVLGLMPCGLIVGVLMAAITAPTVPHVVLAMLAFGLGTMPALVMTHLCGQKLTQKYPQTMRQVTRAMMVWSGCWLFIIAANFIA